MSLKPQFSLYNLMNTPKNNSTIHRDNVYYLDSVIFRVEDELFKVPRYYFERHSEIFESMFSLPPTVGQDVEGSTDGAPLRLDGINKEDFKALLEAIYPLNCKATDPWDGMPKSKWISVLKLATLWMFKELRAGAIGRLTNMAMSPIEQVLLAKQYNVPQWLYLGYGALIDRSEMLSLEDARQLTYPTALLVFQAREEARARSDRRSAPGSLGWMTRTDDWGPPASPRHVQGQSGRTLDPSDIIERVFKKELEELIN